jgi:sulfur carrier protein
VKLTVNGEEMDLPEGTTAAALLDQLKLNPGLVVVELNLNILKRDELPKTALKEGDQVEIVHFVGGGS